MSLFADDMILYLKDLIESTNKFLKLIKLYNKVAWCKIIIKSKSPYIPTMKSQRNKIEKNIPFKITQKLKKK